MKPTEDQIRAALATVNEPDVGRDIVAAGVVKAIEAGDGRATVRLELRTPIAATRQAIEAGARQALAPLGIAALAIESTVAIAGRRPGPGQARLPAVKNIVAVASGKGGVGKSTVATNLALALKRHGGVVGVLDADVFGPSIPRMLGEPERPAVASGDKRIVPALHFSMPVMSIGFFVEREGAVIWRGPMVHKLLQQFVEDVEWGELDYLVCDLPPGTGDVQLSLSQLIPMAGAVMVTTPQEVAVMDVVRGISMFRKTEVPLVGIVENMSWYTCPACGHHDEIFARGGGRRLAEEQQIPFLGELPIDSRIRAGGDVGRPIVLDAPDSDVGRAYLEIAARVAGRLSAMSFAGPKRSPSLVSIR